MTPYGVTRPVRPMLTRIVEQLGVDLLGRVLERDRPPRRPAGRAEPALQRRPRRPSRPRRRSRRARCRGGARRRARCRPRPPRGSGSTLTCSEVGSPQAARASYAWDCAVGSKPSRAPMPWQTMPSARVAVTRGSFCRSEPAAALRGLANIGLPASDIDSLSRSNASPGRNTSPRTSSSAGHRELLRRLQPVRDRVDGLDVGGDVLAGDPVAAGQRADQPAVLVEQVDRQPVDLELAQQRGVLDAVPGQPGVPGLQLLVAERVVEALHPLQVVDAR